MLLLRCLSPFSLFSLPFLPALPSTHSFDTYLLATPPSNSSFLAFIHSLIRPSQSPTLITSPKTKHRTRPSPPSFSYLLSLDHTRAVSETLFFVSYWLFAR
ncbi:hypothetical protein BKA57DRAFT_445940 [Linnemannia elongata]|nr:hypothetical protein BKA57DRAFT_445940 [Linnemannia elongata]